MKIGVCSDLHLEFGDIELKNPTGIDVLILSGDICTAVEFVHDSSIMAQRYHEFFKQCCEVFPHVIYVMGNHEHYNGDYANTYSILKEHLAYPNLYILDKETVTISDVTFIGGTLWTDMNGENEATINHVSFSMNDFRIVKNSNVMSKRNVPLYSDPDAKGNREITGWKYKDYPSTLHPRHVIEDFKAMVEFIDETIKNNPTGKFVVVGHHAPSKKSTHPRYQNDTLMNGGYSSTLDFFIEDHPQIVLWTHGHTHHKFDYEVGKTRIFCNPRGYINYEPQATNFTLASVTI